jgi:cytochrome P450
MYEISEIFKSNTLIHAIFKNVERYGKVFGFYIGLQSFVVIADYHILKEVMKDEAICSRQDMTPINEYRPGHWTLGKENIGRQPGVSFSQGRYWKEQRRFLLRNLKDFGFGKLEMEDTLLDEVDKLCNEYSKLKGQPVCLDNTLNLSVVNALWAILTGEKLPLKDPKLLRTVSSFNKTVRDVKYIGNLFLSLTPTPLMRLSFTEKNVGLNTWKDALEHIRSILEDQVKEHKDTIDEDSARDMMDLYLNEIENTTDPESSFFQERGYFAMLNSFIDLFIAGMETTSSSLLWTFLYMLHHPDVKRKVQLELDEV